MPLWISIFLSGKLFENTVSIFDRTDQVLLFGQNILTFSILAIADILLSDLSWLLHELSSAFDPS